MNTPETIYHQLLDSFTSSHVCFALYRLPWTDEPILIMQEEGEPEYIYSLNELNQKKWISSFSVSVYSSASGRTHPPGHTGTRLGRN